MQDDDETSETKSSIKTTSQEKQGEVEQEKWLLHNCTYLSCTYLRYKFTREIYYSSNEFNNFISIFATISVSKALPVSAATSLTQRERQGKIGKLYMDRSTQTEEARLKL